jgi:hypothetical protein
VGLANRYWPRPTPPLQPWTLTEAGPSSYRLTNFTGGEVGPVQVSAGDYPEHLLRQTGPWDRISAGGSVEFLVITTGQLDTPTLTISWKDRRRWDYDWSTRLP